MLLDRMAQILTVETSHFAGIVTLKIINLSFYIRFFHNGCFVVFLLLQVFPAYLWRKTWRDPCFYRLFTTFWLDLQKYRLEILEKDDPVSKIYILILFYKSNVFPRLNVNLAKYYINKMM